MNNDSNAADDNIIQKPQIFESTSDISKYKNSVSTEVIVRRVITS